MRRGGRGRHAQDRPRAPRRRGAHSHDRGTPRARGRRRVRDRDRRARQGRLRAALPRRRHRGHRRPGPVRERLGPADRRQLHARPRRRPSRTTCRSTPATSASTCRPPSRCSRRPSASARPTTSPTSRPARTSAALAVMVLSYAAQSARGLHQPDRAAAARSTRARPLAEKFLIRWKGEADPEHVKAIDAYWCSAAEHGMNASTFTARVITSTGADVAAAFSGAIGAMSGPLHGGAPSRVLGMIEEVEKTGDAAAYVKELLDNGERLMGFGHRVYRAEDPRARVLRRTAQGARRPALRGRRGARAGRPRRAPRAPTRPGARDQRRVLGRDRPRLRRGPRATCSPRCSPVPAPAAGRRTSSSRSAPAG